jgi:hypothetical protein
MVLYPSLYIYTSKLHNARRSITHGRALNYFPITLFSLLQYTVLKYTIHIHTHTEFAEESRPNVITTHLNSTVTKTAIFCKLFVFPQIYTHATQNALTSKQQKKPRKDTKKTNTHVLWLRACVQLVTLPFHRAHKAYFFPQHSKRYNAENCTQLKSRY